MDKAAVLAYCQVKSKDGAWIGCECCFTIVYDVMVVCTSIYKRDRKSQSKLWPEGSVASKSANIWLSARHRGANSTTPVLVFATGPKIPHAFAHLSKVRTADQTAAT